MPCAVDASGISYARPAKLGKPSSSCISTVFDGIIAPDSTLCTDNEKAYRAFSKSKSIHLIQMDTDSHISVRDGISYGIQRINAYHRTLKEFIGRFHGVSTKHLGNYIVWNNLIANNRRKSEETLGQLFARMLSAGISVRNKDISSRSPLPSLEV